MKVKAIVPAETIINKILFIRNQKVIPDRDLAVLYGVETRALKQAVKRNIARFPADFIFILTQREINRLVTKCDAIKKLPWRSRTNGIY